MDLNERRIKKERGMTPKELLQEYEAREDINELVIIAKTDGGEYETSISAESDDSALLMITKTYHMEANYSIGLFDD